MKGSRWAVASLHVICTYKIKVTYRLRLFLYYSLIVTSSRKYKKKKKKKKKFNISRKRRIDDESN
jgi:GT2 family glycosyltransferase